MAENGPAYTFQLNRAVRVRDFPLDPGLGYRILIGNPDAVSNVVPLANSYRANKDNFARFLNLDFCSAVVDDAV